MLVLGQGRSRLSLTGDCILLFSGAVFGVLVCDTVISLGLERYLCWGLIITSFFTRRSLQVGSFLDRVTNLSLNRLSDCGGVIPDGSWAGKWCGLKKNRRTREDAHCLIYLRCLIVPSASGFVDIRTWSLALFVHGGPGLPVENDVIDHVM